MAAAESPTSVRKGYFFFFINQSLNLFFSLSQFDFIVIFFVIVVVHLRATGDAPILKQSKFKVLFLFN